MRPVMPIAVHPLSQTFWKSPREGRPGPATSPSLYPRAVMLHTVLPDLAIQEIRADPVIGIAVAFGIAMVWRFIFPGAGGHRTDSRARYLRLGGFAGLLSPPGPTETSQ